MEISPHSSRNQLLDHFSMEMYSLSSGESKVVKYPYGSNFLTGLNPLWVFETIKHNGRKSGPYMMYFDATNKCGDHCEMCFLYENRKNTGLKSQIEIEKAFKFLDKAISLSPFLKSVVIGGPGEPLEYSHFEEVVKYFHTNGLATHIYSSGNGKIRKYLDSIVECVTLFRVSLDAVNEDTYLKTHGKKDFKKRVEYLNTLVSERNRKKSELLIGTHFVIQSHNYSEIIDFAKMVKEIGVDYVEYVWESYYVVNGLTDFQIDVATDMLNSIQDMRSKTFSIISPLGRKKHQLEKEVLTTLTSEQVERHCHDLTGRLNFTVGGNVSLCAKERFESDSVFNIGGASPETAIKLRNGIDAGFSEVLPKGKFEVGCAACFCNNYNRTMNSMINFIETHPDARAKLIALSTETNA
jgi:MoaA/NifB/PqqE/SkfB family radical SAM enzyme